MFATPKTWFNRNDVTDRSSLPYVKLEMVFLPWVTELFSDLCWCCDTECSVKCSHCQNVEFDSSSFNEEREKRRSCVYTRGLLQRISSAFGTVAGRPAEPQQSYRWVGDDRLVPVAPGRRQDAWRIRSRRWVPHNCILCPDSLNSL